MFMFQNYLTTEVRPSPQQRCAAPAKNHMRRLVLQVLLVMVSAASLWGQAAPAEKQSPPAQLPAKQTKEAPNPRLDWWRQARFGMFIHWGLYAIPAGEWKGKPIAGIGEWIMNRAKIPVTEYEQLAKQFNPVKFDPDAWAQMAQDAGMKYLVITSKHHDGFAIYHSTVSKYNVVDATPFKRDVIKELSAACARHGIRF